MTIPDVYIWVDVIFFTLYPIILIALGLHFVGNILTGRAYRRFMKWEWPEHEGPPPRALPKFLHFQHLVCIGLLILSGLYIRFPFFNDGRDLMRWVHYIAMTIVTLNLIWRLWYAFGSPQRDFREFAITKRDITTLPKVVMYYVFIKPSKPHLGKYNVMQKSTYILFVPMLIAQAITGLSLLEFVKIPWTQWTVSYAMLGWWATSVPGIGGTADAVAWARILHYTINWLFIVFVTIHVYLSVTEDFAAFLDFFGLGFLDRGNGHEHVDELHPGPPPAIPLPGATNCSPTALE